MRTKLYQQIQKNTHSRTMNNSNGSEPRRQGPPAAAVSPRVTQSLSEYDAEIEEQLRRRALAQQPPPPMGPSVIPNGAFPGSLTPGWNDPPPLNPDSVLGNANSRRPRIDPRRRAPYPIESNSLLFYPNPESGGSEPSSRPTAMVMPRQLPLPPDALNGAATHEPDEGTVTTRGRPASGNAASRVPTAVVPPRMKKPNHANLPHF
ncbi:uncharacterized protein LOC117891111 [Drosophila subobscura]|uniref:uncharacterized protein LOC117891111 n=1 Tax=Drosophila subobscura TaxID=7241 RepID=UPI00155A3FA5|nr:uncharacterized protein LOC117891111 [Drosophila subobscura]